MQDAGTHNVSQGTPPLPITFGDIDFADKGELFPWDAQWLKDARRFYHELVLNGQANRERCKICGAAHNCYAHFPNPERALDVVWICHTCVGKFKTRQLPVKRLIDCLTPEMLGLWEKRKEKKF